METSKPWSPSQLAEELEKAKDEKMPNKTLFGDLNGLVPPYGSTKHDNIDNPTNFRRQ